MDKRIITILLVTGTLLFAVYFVFTFQKNPVSNMSKDPSNSQEMMKKDVTTADDDSEKMMAKNENGRYITYSQSTFQEISTENVVLFFYANWCPNCIPVDKEISKNINKIPDNTTIVRVNYSDNETDEDEKDLATKYGITYQHTFVLTDKSGMVIQKWNGGNLDTILDNIK